MIIRIKRLFCLLMAAMLLASLGGCLGKPEYENRPYEPDTPAPSPLNGVFTSEGGSMTFNGDGKTIVLDLESGFAGRTGLPAGHSEGTFAFVQDLPPYGHVDVRYDTAHDLDITVGEGEDRIFVTLEIGYISEDGSTAMVYIGAVTETCIPILLTEGTYENFLFQKQETEAK